METVVFKPLFAPPSNIFFGGKKVEEVIQAK